MDQATALKILQNHGADPTVENINKVMQQSGRGTELLGRSMGLQGGFDESGPGMDLILDKHMKQTARAPVATETTATVNPNSESNGAPQNGGARAAPVAASPNRQMNYGPAANDGRNRQANYGPGSSGTTVPANESVPSAGNPNVLDGSTTRGYQNETANREAANRPLGGSDDNSGLNWLLAALGLTAAGASMRGGGIPINNPPELTGPAAPKLIEGANPNQKRLPAPSPKLTDESGPKMESGAPIPPKQPVGGPAAPQTPDDIAKLKAEVDAENEALKAEEAKRNANSRGKGAGAGRAALTDAQKTAEAARKLFRR